VIGPDDLHDIFHAQAATIEPAPHLAELGTGLTIVERHRRTRAVVTTTIAAVAVAAAVTAVRAVESRPNHIDTAPAAQQLVIAPDSQTATSTTVPAVVATAPAPTTAPPATTAQQPAPTTAAPSVPAGVAPAPTTAPAPASAGTHGAPARVLTFRAASVSDLSSADPPAADYFGVAPPGATITAASPYGTATTQAGPDGQWSIHLPMPDAPLGQRFRVVLSAPPLPSLTFNFTHTAD
jgi:hypothetical protein